MSRVNLIRVLMLVSAASFAQAQTFKVVHEFNRANGAYAQGSLTFVGNGTFAGMTSYGGVSANDGNVFKLTASGQETVLHNFSGADGARPYLGSLIKDTAGNLYGTTWYGGDLSCQGGEGCGTVFKVDPSGKETVLHNFEAQNDGQFPFSSLVLDPSGNLYGTTSDGIDYGQNGLVFQVNSATGAESVIYQFNGQPDGSYPEAGMVPDSNGNLYGTTAFGGSGTGPDCGNAGCGAVFELSPNGSGGWKETVLYSFQGSSDGKLPYTVTRDSSGNLYGVTQVGGNGLCFNGAGCGTVFKLSPNSNGGWTETVLYRFGGFPGNDGAYPYDQLVLDPAGNLYGTTYQGGGSKACSLEGTVTGCGTVFKIDPSGKETILHKFGLTDGAYPYGGLTLEGGTSTLYGITASGGGPGQGVVFTIGQ
jgi:uncharacterized repeat protein (TIGR03803 family)